MKFYGITGGIGAGKSEVLNYLKDYYKAEVLSADKLAGELMTKEGPCKNLLSDLFSEEGIDGYNEDGSLNRSAISDAMFKNNQLRKKVNNIVHPAVKEEVLRLASEYNESGAEFFFIEAALLIEEHYDEICDELWYVYSSQKVRRRRLIETRGMNDKQINLVQRTQKGDDQFRKKCTVVIENNGTQEELHEQIDRIMKGLGAKKIGKDAAIWAHMGPKEEESKKEIEKEEKETVTEDVMEEELKKEDKIVFGLDIGTRNVVGTVGHLTENNGFYVISQCSMEHDSRAMMDGQIHDINRVAKVVQKVKEKLEEDTGITLKEVCIAAAGRVLRTITTHVSHEYPESTVVTEEDLHTLDLLGIDKAQQELLSEGETKYRFYCVGYSVMKYYSNGDIMSNIEGHKADEIAEDIIVTFLPEDVVDGLYTAVERAGLSVANLTLEPIAAINVAIPENFRLLNIALVDVGAGTSDICITRDGSIIAYGMIPYAGDELTEVIVQEYLVDFAMAEHIKKESLEKNEIEYEDIMGLKHTIKAEDVWKLTEPVKEKITAAISEKIKELNNKSVSAAFVVGGGGKIHGFCEALADKLGIAKERVALRGEEVMKNIEFEDKTIKKDPLLVTPIGICLNYFESKNNFIMIHFNGEMMKLYDNGHLTIFDAALQAGFMTEELFPQRGKEITYTVNGTKRMLRGEKGESAVILMNGNEVGMNEKLVPNSDVRITPSTEGTRGVLTVESLPEFNGDKVTFVVNNHLVGCPKFVEVNGILEPGSYEIKDGDVIETRNYYTVGQLKEFMDVELDPDSDIIVNNRVATEETLIYENFNIEWNTLEFGALDDDYKSVEESELYKEEQAKKAAEAEAAAEEAGLGEEESDKDEVSDEEDKGSSEAETEETTGPEPDGITVYVNGAMHKLTGKASFLFVDVFDAINFDPKSGNGRSLTTKRNGMKCGYATELADGDHVEVFWNDK